MSLYDNSLYFCIKNRIMGIFDRFVPKRQKNVRTTEGFCLGVTEAEGEAHNSSIVLSEVFEDFLDVIKRINNEKFIILGRKGCGKSAIGEHIYDIAQSDPNIFVKFIRKTDIDIEQIVQIGIKENQRIEQEMLYKWVILTQLLDLITQNQNVSNLKEMSSLKKFVHRNRGFIDIKKNEIKEIIRENGFNINLEYFKRFYKAAFNKNITIKEEKASFFKLIPYLEEAIVNIFKQDVLNSYILIFDDLDIGYYKSSNDIQTLSELLRISKYYNNELFGRNQLCSKIIILLRNDIAKHLRFNADSAKIFASYAIELNWYEEIYRLQENKLNLKKFINKRIARNFEINGMEYMANRPWESFVNEQDFISSSKSSFKYILDHTFYRPRDLILFFKDIDRYRFPIPISRTNINLLIGNYADQMLFEIQNELTASFTKKEIQAIITTLRLVQDKKTFSYNILEKQLALNGFDNANEVIDELFYYSLIGNINEHNGVYFKFREKGSEIRDVNTNESLILHNILKVYFRRT